MPDINDYSLRPLELEDAELILKWRNSERIRKNMYTDHLISIDEHKAWIKNVITSETARYLIFESKCLPIGFVSFTGIDNKNNRCYWAFYIGEETAPKGSGSIMELLALEYAFSILKINKLCCEVFLFNESVIKMHKKFNFKEEGHFIGHYVKNGIPEDVISLALFKDDWMKNKEIHYKRLFD